MGHPKKHRRKYAKPKKPYYKDRIENEKKLKQEFGLRRKQEIWRAESILRNFRRRARELQAYENEKKKKDLLSKLNRLGIHATSLEDVLEIKLEDILSRRLQSIVNKKSISNNIKQARQLIVHGHVFIENNKIRYPSYMVPAELEDKITINPKMKDNLLAEPISKQKTAKKAPKEAKEEPKAAEKEKQKKEEKPVEKNPKQTDSSLPKESDKK